MIWQARDIDLELALTAWQCYDYNYPREFPEILYVSVTGVSDTDTGQACIRYERSWDLEAYATADLAAVRTRFLAATHLTTEEWERVPLYRPIDNAPEQQVNIVDFVAVRLAFAILGGAFAVLALLAALA